MKKAVLSLSGGMDSSSLLLHLLANGYEVTALGFDYGQKHKVELERATSLVDYINSYCVVDEESKLLVERTKEALDRAISVVAPGRPINVIGRVIESYAKRFGYGVVEDFTGHGVHTVFHSGLIIPHYDEPTATTIMQSGMTFTIEPMITLGTIEYDVWPDGWTITTLDKKRTAQFEHTLVVTEDGCEILTLPSEQP
jgi:methionine aminopeptidase type I